jgi:hypothetical protein
MSLSQVRRLTSEHRKAQLGLRAATLRDLLRLWPAFDINNIPRTWGAFEEAALLLVQNRSRTSGGLASVYYRTVREAVEASGRAAPKLYLPKADDVLAGLRIVGPVNAAKQLSLGRPAAEVAKATLINLSGETTRHVLNAGRRTVDQSVMADEQAIGWRRVTSGSACEFCSMLASRGTVYKSDTVDFSAHRHCACFPEPAFK